MDDDDDEAPAAPADAPLRDAMRMAEALIFAAPDPVSEAELARRLPDGIDLAALLDALKRDYADRGIVLQRVGGAWTFRSAPDLAWLLGAGFAPLVALSASSRLGLPWVGVYLLSGAIITLVALAIDRRQRRSLARAGERPAATAAASR